MPARRLLTVVLFAALAARGPAAPAQAVGFAPVVGSFPNGVGVGTTPVVSADRRYVRLGVDAGFSALEGFDTASIPAAVSGGPGGNGGGIPGGFRSAGVGDLYSAGMDGVVGPARPYGGVAGMGLPGGSYAAPEAAFVLNGGLGVARPSHSLPVPHFNDETSPPPRSKAKPRSKVRRRPVPARPTPAANPPR